ncbi:50S ribosomal protein L25 [Paenibacillus yonginensis]|uniref:Large ribosomal subunit protein bL25 n=1 Tax=Paenibacillus yonginensis TaxID=1462996 RepID=A0A1B1N1W9_9BACL|nr:50S ribosomal protein L25 [Paenibacillus yonginensis]ANS75409.1 50S ribosomal protein L25 [Paenibacillus yonginensis]
MSSGHNVTLQAEKRTDLTRSALRQLRQSGRVPGVIYGSQIESQQLSVDEKELLKVARTGRTEFFQLKLEGGETLPALIKDIQKAKGQVAHVDFQHVSRNKPIRVSIPVHYHGTATGTKEGGILQTLITELEVEGLPDDLPTGIEVDVTNLGVGDKLTLAEVSMPQGITLHVPEDTLLASIVVPRGADVDEEAETEGGAEGEAAPEAASEEAAEEAGA